MTDRILRRPEVQTRCGIGRSTLYDWMSRGEFPQPVKLSARLVGWKESAISDWLDSRKPRVAVGGK